MGTDRGPRAPAWRRAAGAALALALFVLGSVDAGAASETEEKLEAAKARLEQIRREVGAQESRLAALRAEVNAAAGRVERAHHALDDTLKDLAALRDRIERARQRYETVRARLDARARDAFIEGPASGLEFILQARSIVELTERVEFVEAVTETDAELANEVANLRSELELEEADLERLRARQVDQARELEAQEEVLQTNLAEQSSILAELSDAEAEIDALVADLAAKHRAELRAAARAARQAARAARGGHPGLSGDGPLFLCPVQPPYGYSSTFGDPRSGGRTHQGNDIFAPAGNAVYAPFDGTASDATNWPLGGISVKVYGADGYTYGAHLSALGKLGSVKAGDVVGYVGNTGNASSTAPHLHFEWHPGGGNAVDPYPYLNEVC
ncbi:MAG: peptidoglycan DD-metalloendopeptidase family protein [Actinobacteria bacterium]|nr:peptidoglycan DD-metalloendopeptidase family protein [Actinomycetota bacterium]